MSSDDAKHICKTNVLGSKEHQPFNSIRLVYGLSGIKKGTIECITNLRYC